jgi:broad specificity phosphatase PhoE
MKPNRIILVRHGHSEGNADRKNYESIPDYALNLTEVGRTEALGAGHEIADIIGRETVSAYVSSYYRARQTFELISSVIGDRIVRSIEDPRIREQDWGHLRHPDDNEGIIRERREFSTFYFRIPDGESGADVFDRVSTFLETLHRDFARDDYPENTLIITHGMTLRLFLMRWYHWSVEDFESLRNPANAKVVVMERAVRGSYRLVSELVKRNR